MADKGNYRSTRIVMFDSGKYQALKPNEKLVLLTLKHGTLSNMIGIFVFRTGQLHTLVDQTGLSIKAIEGALNGLRRQDWTKQSDGVLWIRNQLKHDPHINLNNDNQLKGVYNVLDRLPKDDLILDFCEYYGLRRPFDSPSDPLRSTETETETETEIETETEPPIDRFNKWRGIKKNIQTIDRLATEHKLSKSTVEKEISKMKAWIIANPAKGNKSKWAAFMNNWFQKKREDDLKQGRADDYSGPPK